LSTKVNIDTEILGTGCSECNRLLEIAKEAVQAADLSGFDRVTTLENLQ